MPLDLGVSEMPVNGERLFCGVLRDVTERLASEQALRASERKLRSYIEQSLEGVMVVDGQGRYLETNPAAADMLGYTEHELLQMTVADLLPPEGPEREAGMAHFQRAATEGRATGEVVLCKRGGQRFVVDPDAGGLGGDPPLGGPPPAHGANGAEAGPPAGGAAGAAGREARPRALADPQEAGGEGRGGRPQRGRPGWRRRRRRGGGRRPRAPPPRT